MNLAEAPQLLHLRHNTLLKRRLRTLCQNELVASASMLTTGDCCVLVLVSMLARYATLSSRLICKYLAESALLCNAISCSLSCMPRWHWLPRAPVKSPHVCKQTGGVPACGVANVLPAFSVAEAITCMRVHASVTSVLSRTRDGRELWLGAYFWKTRSFCSVAHRPPPHHVTDKENPRENLQRRERRRRASASSLDVGPCTYDQHPQARYLSDSRSGPAQVGKARSGPFSQAGREKRERTTFQT